MKTQSAVNSLVSWLCCGLCCSAAADTLFEIQVIDKQTRRGVPMVELITVDCPLVSARHLLTWGGRVVTLLCKGELKCLDRIVPNSLIRVPFVLYI